MSESDDWQRLSPLALVFLIVSGLQRQVRENLFLFAGAGAGAAFTDWLGLRELALIALVFVLFSVLGAMLYHRRFRFRMEADAVRVRRGLVEHKELRVRFARVQNIQLGQPFYFRPFNLVRFSLQTPGASDKEVELPGIDRSLAETMRDRISAARGELEETEARPEPEEGADPEPLEQAAVFAPSSGRLFLHGLSSNQVWVIAGLFFYVGGNLLERFGERVEQVAERALENGQAIDLPVSAWALGAGALLVFLLILFVLSGLLALVRFWRFRLRERGDRVIALAGLFDRREQTLRRAKVTGLQLRQSAVGRVLGCWSLVLRQTRSSDHETPAGGNAFVVPGLRQDDLALAEALLPGAVFPGRFQRISPRYRRFAFSRLLLSLLLALVLAGLLFGFDHWSLLALSVGALVALPVLHLRFRQWGWALEEGVLWVRRGLFGQRIDGFDLEQVQQARVTSSPYLRRHDLVGLELVLPQGVIGLPFLPSRPAAELANRSLAAAEQARFHRV